MSENTAKVGRPRKPAGEKVVTKSVSLHPAEWEALSASDPDGSPTREAARRLRRSMAVDDMCSGEES